MGSTIAHELGHQLGLFHTTERDGTSSSPVTTIAPCALAPGEEESDPELCPDGGNLMFWTSGGQPQTSLNVDQDEVLDRNPIVY